MGYFYPTPRKGKLPVARFSPLSYQKNPVKLSCVILLAVCVGGNGSDSGLPATVEVHKPATVELMALADKNPEFKFLLTKSINLDGYQHVLMGETFSVLTGASN
jgi:hypothetical protein